jgi:hypothetical protein
VTDKSKGVMAALAVLVIGIAIGALVVGPVLARHHFRDRSKAHGEESFVTRFEHRIGPTPDQADEVRAILTRYAKRIEELRSLQRTEAEAVFDSLDAELAPVLTEEQRQRLERDRNHAGRPPGERR